MIILYLIFFQSSDDHQFLHSFPTRRSSDLNSGSLAGAVLSEARFSATSVMAKLPGFGFGRKRASERTADRKSTRLNSSHRCISYAVFCLKKKKKNNALCDA